MSNKENNLDKYLNQSLNIDIVTELESLYKVFNFHLPDTFCTIPREYFVALKRLNKPMISTSALAILDEFFDPRNGVRKRLQRGIRGAHICADIRLKMRRFANKNVRRLREVDRSAVEFIPQKRAVDMIPDKCKPFFAEPQTLRVLIPRKMDQNSGEVKDYIFNFCFHRVISLPSIYAFRVFLFGALLLSVKKDT